MVRSIARGNETVPTVTVGDPAAGGVGLVNPNVGADPGRRRHRLIALPGPGPTRALASVGVNVLLITLDQFRGRLPVGRRPSGGAHAAPRPRSPREGVRLARHYSQAAPCAPGRASLYTGMYQMNNRVVANGTPLDARFDNVAHAARRAGYDAGAVRLHRPEHRPARGRPGPTTPAVRATRACCPASTSGARTSPATTQAWLDWLRELGYTGLGDGYDALAHRARTRPAEHSVSAFLTDHADRLDRSGQPTDPWFAHRQLPAAAPAVRGGRRSSRRRTTRPTSPLPIAPAATSATVPRRPAAPTAQPRRRADEREIRRAARPVLRHDQRGRRTSSAASGRRCERLGQWDDTWIVVTSDHGEQLGDHGLIGKLGFFEGELPHPRHRPRSAPSRRRTAPTVERFTENVDVFPTLCDVHRHRRAGAVRRPAAHAVPARRAAAVVARRRALGVRLARSCCSPHGPHAVAVGPAPRAPAPRRAARRDARVRAVRRRHRGCASTSRPTPRGAPRSPTRRGCCPTRRRC